MYGRELSREECTLDIREDSTLGCFPLSFPEGQEVCYYSLRLKDAEGHQLSDNFYVQGRETDNFKALLDLPEARVKTGWDAGVLTLKNVSDVPAMMLRLIALDPGTGERVLPAVYSDNYFHLMPGEERSIAVSSWDGVTPVEVAVRGFNLR